MGDTPVAMSYVADPDWRRTVLRFSRAVICWHGRN